MSRPHRTTRAPARTRPPAAAPLAVLVLLPALAGCTLLEPPRPGPEQISPLVVREAFVATDLQLSVDNPYGNVRASGRALAVPVALGGAEAAAVYLGAQVGWRTDAIHQVREQPPAPGDLYVQPPLGEWAGHRERATWRPATAEDLSSAGFADPTALFLQASRLIPPNASRPEARLWFVNGTVAAQIRPDNMSLASEAGPYVFQRDPSGFVVIDNRTLVTWREGNRSLTGSNDGLLEAVSLDPELASVQFSWNATRIDARVRTPPFRTTDVKVDDDRLARIIAVELPGVARLSMVKYVTSSVQENRVELRTQNITLVMAP